MVAQWEYELQVTLTNVNAVTNAEDSGFEIRGNYVDSTEVYFKVPVARLQGIIRTVEDDDGLVHTILSGRDDSDIVLISN